MGLMEFRNFSIPYVFEIEESISRSFTKLPCLGNLENLGQLPVLQVLEGTDDCMGLMDFRNFFTTYVFGVEKSIFGSSTELSCSGNLENPGQLPVLQVLEGTDDCVLLIFVISSLHTFSGSRNPFFIVSRSYVVWMTSKIQVNFRFCRSLRVLMIVSYGFS